MSTDVAVPNEVGISMGLAAALKPTHYELPADATFDDWASHIETLSALEERVQFWIGDCLIAGEDRFSDRYSQMCDATGLSRATLHNNVWVARRFPPHRRLPDAEGNPLLSFGHYKRLAGLEDDAEQDRWLAQAVENHWSIEQMDAHRNGQAVSGAPVVSRPDAPSHLDEVVKSLNRTFQQPPDQSQEFDVPTGWGTIRVQLILDGDQVDAAEYEVVEA